MFGKHVSDDNAFFHEIVLQDEDHQPKQKDAKQTASISQQCFSDEQGKGRHVQSERGRKTRRDEQNSKKRNRRTRTRMKMKTIVSQYRPCRGRRRDCSQCKVIGRHEIVNGCGIIARADLLPAPSSGSTTRPTISFDKQKDCSEFRLGRRGVRLSFKKQQNQTEATKHHTHPPVFQTTTTLTPAQIIRTHALVDINQNTHARTPCVEIGTGKRRRPRCLFTGSAAGPYETKKELLKSTDCAETLHQTAGKQGSMDTHDRMKMSAQLEKKKRVRVFRNATPKRLAERIGITNTFILHLTKCRQQASAQSRRQVKLSTNLSGSLTYLLPHAFRIGFCFANTDAWNDGNSLLVK